MLLLVIPVQRKNLTPVNLVAVMFVLPGGQIQFAQVATIKFFPALPSMVTVVMINVQKKFAIVAIR